MIVPPSCIDIIYLQGVILNVRDKLIYTVFLRQYYTLQQQVISQKSWPWKVEVPFLKIPTKYYLPFLPPDQKRSPSSNIYYLISQANFLTFLYIIFLLQNKAPSKYQFTVVIFVLKKKNYLKIFLKTQESLKQKRKVPIFLPPKDKYCYYFSVSFSTFFLCRFF